nr:MAG TPA: hypothetical protein [Caudoviricetes sp.]
MADLWIRTQAENLLLRVDNIAYCGTEIYTYNHEAATSIDLGTYDTEERAKEILDEIQNLLVQPAAFLKADMPQGFPLEATKEYIKQINKFCGQNNLLYVGSKDVEVIPTNNTNIVYQMPEK